MPRATVPLILSYSVTLFSIPTISRYRVTLILDYFCLLLPRCLDVVEKDVTSIEVLAPHPQLGPHIQLRLPHPHPPLMSMISTAELPFA